MKHIKQILEKKTYLQKRVYMKNVQKHVKKNFNDTQKAIFILMTQGATDKQMVEQLPQLTFDKLKEEKEFMYQDIINNVQ